LRLNLAIVLGPALVSSLLVAALFIAALLRPACIAPPGVSLTLVLASAVVSPSGLLALWATIETGVLPVTLGVAFIAVLLVGTTVSFEGPISCRPRGLLTFVAWVVTTGARGAVGRCRGFVVRAPCGATAAAASIGVARLTIAPGAPRSPGLLLLAGRNGRPEARDGGVFIEAVELTAG
jgi:hypothetical protein